MPMYFENRGRGSRADNGFGLLPWNNESHNYIFKKMRGGVEQISLRKSHNHLYLAENRMVCLIIRRDIS